MTVRRHTVVNMRRTHTTQEDERTANILSGFTAETLKILKDDPADRDSSQLKQIVNDLKTSSFWEVRHAKVGGVKRSVAHTLVVCIDLNFLCVQVKREL